MSSKKYIFYITLLFFYNFCFGQSSGSINFELVPSFAEFRINNKVYEFNKTKTITIPAGTYELEVWAPKLKVYKDTITLKESTYQNYILGLHEQSDLWREHKKNKKLYYGNKLATYSIDLALTSIFCINSYNLLNTNKKELDAAREANEWARFHYETSASPTKLQEAKKGYDSSLYEFEQAQKDFNNKIVFNAISLSVTGTIMVFYFSKLRKLSINRIKQPVYKEDHPFYSRIQDIKPLIHYSNNSFLIGINTTF